MQSRPQIVRDFWGAGKMLVIAYKVRRVFVSFLSVKA
jgi:hypothetical protein